MNNKTPFEFEFSNGQLHLTKVITPSNSALEVAYIITNPNTDSIALTLTAENAFSPSYLDAMDYGRQSLKYWNGQTVTDSADSSTVGVTNTRTGSAVTYEFISTPAALAGHEVVFGLALSPTYELGIRGYESESVTYRLLRHFNSPPQPFSLIHPLDGSNISFPATFSKTGPDFLQPPHHAAQQSTSTIPSRETVETKLVAVSSTVDMAYLLSAIRLPRPDNDTILSIVCQG